MVEIQHFNFCESYRWLLQNALQLDTTVWLSKGHRLVRPRLKPLPGLFIFAYRVLPKRPIMCFKSANPLISASKRSVIRRTLRQLRELWSSVLTASVRNLGCLRFPLFSTESQNITRAFLPHLTHILCKSVLRVCSNLVGHSSYATLDPSSNVIRPRAELRCKQ